MSNNGVTPEQPSVKPSTADEAQHEAHTRRAQTNGADKPELDEFGLPIRLKKPKIVVEEDQESGSEDAFEDAVGSNGSRDASGYATPAPVQPATKTETGSQEEERPKEMDHAVKEVNGHVGPEESRGSDSNGQLHESRTEEHSKEGSSNDLSVDKPSNGVIPLSPSNEKFAAVSEYSHLRSVAKKEDQSAPTLADEWQEMPAYAPFNMYNDDNKLIAQEAESSDEEEGTYGGLGGAGKGYTRVTLDEDAQSATSMDDNTAYLFKETHTGVVDEDEDSRDALAQMQATKDLLTEGQRIAYVGLTRLGISELQNQQQKLLRTRSIKKQIDMSVEAMKMWGQKMMVRLYSHMDIEPAEQIMIEQLGEHGVQPGDLSPALMQNARVQNPVLEETSSGRPSISSSRPSTSSPKPGAMSPEKPPSTPDPSDAPPAYDADAQNATDEVHTLSELPQTEKIDIDLRWTVLCDLFLVLIADSVYDARSRQLLEKVGSFMDVTWIDICRFEKRVTEALEMQEASQKEKWDEEEHIVTRGKSQRNRRLALMGLATVGGGLVIGLSAGLLAPVIGAGLAAGFTTIGVAGTSGFLAGAGGAAIVTTTGVVTGGVVGVRSAKKRTGAVKTFEYRPLHNNKRTNLIITVSGWMTGKVDDVRLPFSTVDPIMGDIYSIHWEPEMLRSMGDTINILANEALTQTIQQVLGATILTALMAAIQLPIVLSKLSYLIDNPWSNSLARARLAGLILADSLIDRNLGTRPVTLVGFSLGARVIMTCLEELARKGAYGLIQNVYLFGSPIVAKSEDYIKVKTVVTGRFVNGYATNDWILGEGVRIRFLN